MNTIKIKVVTEFEICYKTEEDKKAYIEQALKSTKRISCRGFNGSYKPLNSKELNEH